MGLTEISRFYSETGFLPLPVLVSSHGVPEGFCLHLANRWWVFSALLLLLQMACGVALAWGCWTRLATRLGAYLWLSLLLRNPMVIDHGDWWLLFVLVWGGLVDWREDHPRAPLARWVYPFNLGFLYLGMAYLGTQASVTEALFGRSARPWTFRLLYFADLLTELQPWVCVLVGVAGLILLLPNKRFGQAVLIGVHLVGLVLFTQTLTWPAAVLAILMMPDRRPEEKPVTVEALLFLPLLFLLFPGPSGFFPQTPTAHFRLALVLENEQVLTVDPKGAWTKRAVLHLDGVTPGFPAEAVCRSVGWGALSESWPSPPSRVYLYRREAPKELASEPPPEKLLGWARVEPLYSSLEKLPNFSPGR